MRSLLLTTLLLITATILGALATWQYQLGNLDLILGSPPTPPGAKIYPHLDPLTVSSITLTSGENKAHFVKTPTGWYSTTPTPDRMDPRAPIAILTFAHTTTARDLIPTSALPPDTAGLTTSSTAILLQDPSGKTLAHFRLGRRTPLLQLTESTPPQTIPTTYLLPLDTSRSSHIYAATGDILPLFKDNLKHLRDHHPLYFNPLNLQKIRIRTENGELTLARTTLTSPWRITKPLELSTSPAAVKTLLEGLVTLQATSITDPAKITLPSTSDTSRDTLIAITPFGSTTETTLAILPPENTDSRTAQATVSDRPTTIFTLPLRSQPDLTALSDLPLTVNALRDPLLTNLNIASIRSITIRTATTPTILISRTPPAPWTATINSTSQPANEQRLFDLLKSLTHTRATAFETDSAPPDLSPWGLHRPILSLTFQAADNTSLTISFGLDKNGNLFANRKNSPTIIRLDNTFLDTIAILPQDWRLARLWSLSRTDLTHITITQPPSPPLLLTYNDLQETWKASQSDRDLTPSLDPTLANLLLTTLENLQVARWLPPSHPAALTALKNPTLTFDITENKIDDLGDTIGTTQKTLTLAIDPTSQTAYGITSSDPTPFTLPPETFLKLSIPLLEPSP